MALKAAPRAGDAEAPFAAVQPTPFGAVGVRTEGEALAELIFLPGHYKAQQPRTALAREACRQVAAYAIDADFSFDLPLAARGTEFQRRVWDSISAIPRGRTRGYGDLARDLRSAARAVGQACGSNFFPLVIPCHRVVAAGGLGGFAHHSDGFHLQVKRWLLAHEANSADLL
jgi:methylated-DNA-[protein]-cysteine S-methyltransferase